MRLVLLLALLALMAGAVKLAAVVAPSRPAPAVICYVYPDRPTACQEWIA